MDFCFICGYLLELYGSQLGDQEVHYRMAQKAFVEMTEMIRANSVKMSPGDCQHFVDCGRDGLQALQNLNIAGRPKMHAIVHMVQQVFKKRQSCLMGHVGRRGSEQTVEIGGSGPGFAPFWLV